MNETKQKWYNNKLILFLLTIVFYPVGVYGIIRSEVVKKQLKIIIVTIYSIITFLILLGAFGSSDDASTVMEEPAKISGTENSAETKQAESNPKATASQKNAVKAAKQYLSISSFSKKGLIEQLEFDQFPNADAVYGAENSGADWNEQAAKAAQQYLDLSAFSRGSLIQQLKYDGFTQEQAESGVSAAGL